MKRQFIAGARCPSCGSVDRIQRCEEDETIWMECIVCGMVRNLDDPPPEEEVEEQPVTLRAPVRYHRGNRGSDHGA